MHAHHQQTHITKTLIDGGAGLNVLSVEAFNLLQMSYDQLSPSS